MGLVDILRSLFNILCGSPSQDEQQHQQPQGQKPHTQQPQGNQGAWGPNGQHAQQGQAHGGHQQQHGNAPHNQEQKPHSSYPPKQGSQSPGHGGGRHGSQSPGRRPQHYEDLNQINQADDHYISLRAQANEEGDQMGRAFDESHRAYESGDGAAAKELSNKGKRHQAQMEQLNKQASDWIYVKNNEDSQPGEIDLHGLYVKEAIARTDQAILEAKQRGDKEIHLIVGKGLHSSGGAAKIKPAITELIQKHQLVAELDPQNQGVLVVHLGGSGGGRGVSPDEITRRLGRDEEGCTIM